MYAQIEISLDRGVPNVGKRPNPDDRLVRIICYVTSVTTSRIKAILKRLKNKLGRGLVSYLQRPSRKYEPFSVSDPAILREILVPGDVLLVEGHHKISAAIKYLTQSTWSHSAVYIGDALPVPGNGTEQPVLVEALIREGVIAVPLSKYENYNTRICRPVDLTDEDRHKVVQYMTDSIGKQYDFRNILDLARYLLPTPPVPIRWRRRMLALGSGDPTRAICSTVIAQAFQSVRYPILPHIETRTTTMEGTGYYTTQELLHIRHHSLFVARDFDLSPYFRIVKPTLERGFEYKHLVWYNEPQDHRP